LEDKVSRIDKAIQIQLEKFLARVKLQNDRLKERLNVGERLTSADTNQTNTSELVAIGAIKSDIKRGRKDLKVKLEMLIRSIDEEINNMKSYQQESINTIQDQFSELKRDINGKSTAEGQANTSKPRVIEISAPNDSIVSKVDMLADKIETIEKKGIDSYIGINMNFNERIGEIENKLSALPALDNSSDASNLQSPTADGIDDTRDMKLQFYQSVVRDLTDQLQKAIKTANDLDERIREQQLRERKFDDLKEANEKILENFKKIQLEHETLKKQLDEKDQRILALENRLKT